MNELVRDPAPKLVPTKFDRNPIRTAPGRAVTVWGNARPPARQATTIPLEPNLGWGVKRHIEVTQSGYPWWLPLQLAMSYTGLGRVPDLRVRVRVLVICTSTSTSTSTLFSHKYEYEYWCTSTSTCLWFIPKSKEMTIINKIPCNKF